MALRLIQLGLGGWGRSWVAEVTRTTPGIEPVAWVDRDAATRELAIEQLALPPERVFASVADAAAAVPADAALVVVPLAAHADAAGEALDAGLHVLVEKPFTETLAEAAALVARAEDHGLKLMVNQNYRWFPAPRHARALLHDGAIGRTMAGYLDFHFYYGPGYRYFFLDEPLLSDMAIHHFDGMRFVLGDEPLEVSCQSWNEPDSPFVGRPAAIATIRFTKGTVVSYRGSWLSHAPVTPYGGVWRLDGTKGTIEFTFRGAGEERDTLDRVVVHAPGRVPVAERLPPMPARDRNGALADFAAWIATGKAPDGASTGSDNLHSLAFMFACIRSASTGGATVRVADVLAELPGAGMRNGVKP